MIHLKVPNSSDLHPFLPVIFAYVKNMEGIIFYFKMTQKACLFVEFLRIIATSKNNSDKLGNLLN